MLRDRQKYRANMFQIGGFALMAPSGNLVINFMSIKFFCFEFKFLFYLLIIALLFCIGVIFLVKGYEALDQG